MKTNLLFKLINVAIMAIVGTNLIAGEITLDPSQLIPADTGYYIGGAWKDENKDGVKEFYNECYDAYGDASHNEISTQQGFYYHKCMIMPTCTSKSTQIDPPVATGYIELTKTKYLGTDTAIMGYIITPPFTNLVSLYMETSSDISINPSRQVPYIIEYSTDIGVTWDTINFIKDNIAAEGGYRVTYEKDGAFVEFNKMIEASLAGPIKLRISSVQQPSPPGSQRVKIHKITITADRSTVGIKPAVLAEKYSVKVIGNLIEANIGNIAVYNQLGQILGSGKSVSVRSGMYIVKTANGATHKVIVR